MEQLYNLAVSLFGCVLFGLCFLVALFFGEGILYTVRWLYDRYLWVRWFNRQ